MTSEAPRICSTKKCNAILPPEEKKKTCERCRAKDLERKNRKQKEGPAGAENPICSGCPPPPAPSNYNLPRCVPGDEESEDASEDDTLNPVTRYVIHDMRSFADGLAYQMQFRDERFLTKVETQGRGLLSIIRACLEKERRENSSRSSNPGTWDTEFSSAMFYRSRPQDKHIE
ncbi:hypothetical protein WG66_011640 [Moniliophthora roreri]|nr:hypothetical protein WG66_011640 [Moniliophthora roreri]